MIQISLQYTRGQKMYTNVVYTEQNNVQTGHSLKSIHHRRFHRCTPCTGSNLPHDAPNTYNMFTLHDIQCVLNYINYIYNHNAKHKPNSLM